MAKSKKTSFSQFDPETRRRMGLPDPSKKDRRTKDDAGLGKRKKAAAKKKDDPPRGNRRTRNVRAGMAAEKALKNSSRRK